MSATLEEEALKNGSIDAGVGRQGLLLKVKLLATFRTESAFGARTPRLVRFGVFFTQEGPGQKHPRNEQIWAFLCSFSQVIWRW